MAQKPAARIDVRLVGNSYNNRSSQNRQADRLELHLTALALRGKVFALYLVHCGFQFLGANYWKLFYGKWKMSATGQKQTSQTV